MKIAFEKGRKTKYGEDKKIRLWAKAELISMRDILVILRLLFENEDRIYPRDKGFKGRFMLLDAITDVCNGMKIGDALVKYQLTS